METPGQVTSQVLGGCIRGRVLVKQGRTSEGLEALDLALQTAAAYELWLLAVVALRDRWLCTSHQPERARCEVSEPTAAPPRCSAELTQETPRSTDKGAQLTKAPPAAGFWHSASWGSTCGGCLPPRRRSWTRS
jgi:hypothetical protein